MGNGTIRFILFYSHRRSEMHIASICLILCYAIEATLCRGVDNGEELMLDPDYNSTIVHNLQRRDMQSATVGCQLDSTNKTMYYFVKFGRYYTWIMQDKVEVVVRYANNVEVASQQVAESEVLVFEKHSTSGLQEMFEDGGYLCNQPGKIGEVKGCVGCNMMCLHFKEMEFAVFGRALNFAVEVYLATCPTAFAKIGSPTIQECLGAIGEEKYCHVRHYGIKPTVYDW